MADKVVFRRQVSEFSGQSRAMPDNNLLRLKRISQSFDDLTSETLYSKWKRARKNAAKSDRRDRSVSLGAFPEEDLDINRNGVTSSSAATLQRQVLRPRGWTVCYGELSRDKEKGVLNTSNIPADNISQSRLATNEVDGSTITIVDSSENLDCEVFRVSTPKPGIKESIESKKSRIIKEIVSSAPLKIRRFSESDGVISEKLSARRRLTSDANATGRRNSEARARSLSCREPREFEFLRIGEMAQSYRDSSKTPREDVWQKRSSTGNIDPQGRHKRIPRSRSLNYARSEVNNNACNIQEASLGFQNDRSLPDASKRYRLGCTYALVRQPEQRITHPNQVDTTSTVNTNTTNQTVKVHHRTMSEPNTGSLQSKESRSVEEKEKQERTVKFKEVEVSVSDYKTPHKSEGHGVRRAQTLPRMPKRPLSNLTSRNWKESEMKTRKAAEDLINNINNSDDKTAQERVDVVEKAFEWIRKEVADLRAQDKDIMRMFTKIQAGIRHIKFDQSSMMESEDEFISTPDLSSTPSPGEGTKVHRRASLL